MKAFTKLVIAGTFFGTSTLLSGVILSYIIKHEMKIMLNKVMPLKNGSYTYGPWLNPPLPIYFKMYMFDLKNPLEVINQGAKPVFQEKGPYTYRLWPKKVNITFNQNDTVTYQETHTYVFQRNMSVGPSTDRFLTLNLPLLTVTTLIRKEYSYIKEVLKLMLAIEKSYSLFVNVSVDEFVWGYEDPVLKQVKALLSEFDIPFDDHFGLFYKVNTTDNGVFNVYNGQGELADLTKIHSWNDQTSLSIWRNNQSNMINGTDGHLFHPYIKKEEKIYFFYTYIKRSIYITFDKEVESKGIKLYRFTMPDRVFDSKQPENEGFCIPKGNCPASGLLDLSHVTVGAPVVVSQPHFLGASEAVQNNVRGLHADREKHQCYDDIEPTLGVVLNAQNPIQINAVLKNDPVLVQTAKIKEDIYFPLAWFTAKSDLTDDLADLFRKKFLGPISILHAVVYSLLSVGGFTLFVILLVAIRTFYKYRKEKVDGNSSSEQSKLLSSRNIQE